MYLGWYELRWHNFLSWVNSYRGWKLKLSSASTPSSWSDSFFLEGKRVVHQVENHFPLPLQNKETHSTIYWIYWLLITLPLTLFPEISLVWRNLLCPSVFLVAAWDNIPLMLVESRKGWSNVSTETTLKVLLVPDFSVGLFEASDASQSPTLLSVHSLIDVIPRRALPNRQTTLHTYLSVCSREPNLKHLVFDNFPIFCDFSEVINSGFDTNHDFNTKHLDIFHFS